MSEVASETGSIASITIRVNPDIDAKTHAKITTGTSETKFGVPWSRARDAYRIAARLPNLRVVGVDVHIGSQIIELAPFEAAFQRVAALVSDLRDDGHSIERIDLGGGLGVRYTRDNNPTPDPGAYGEMVARLTGGLGANLIFEPGRLIAANAGILVASVIYVKEGEAKTFLIVDAGMNDLIRPAMYHAYHDILPVTEAAPGTPRVAYDVVGPVCESSDIFAANRGLPEQKAGDLIAIMTAGAYGAVMASAYNARPLAPEVLVKQDRFSVVRPRMDDDTLIAADRVPDWLSDASR